MQLDGEAPELQIETDGALALPGEEACRHLEQLMGLRDWLARLQREVYEKTLALDESRTAARRDYVKIAGTMVAIVDDLRRLSNDAMAVIEQDDLAEDGPPKKRGLLAFRKREHKQPSNAAAEWIRAIGRGVASATTQLESLGIQRIELLQVDLRDLVFEGQPLKAWVSVKNRPQGDTLVVQKSCGVSGLACWKTN